jgi:transketolase
MWNTDILVDNFLDEESLDEKALRDAGGEALVEIGEANEDVVVLNADLPGSLRIEEFIDKFPDRYVQVGVAEQAMAGIGVGLAYQGKLPVITSFAAFSPAMNWSQIRLGAMTKDLPLTVLSSHYGLNFNADGASAQMLSDVALMRTMANMQVISPIDFNQTKAALKEVVTHKNPKYFRVTRMGFPVFIKKSTPFEFGKAQILREGEDITIATTGSVGYEAVKTAEALEKKGISAELINIHTIKPLDVDSLEKSLAKTGKLAVIEEHQRAGGLGSAILEELTERLEFRALLLGVDDKYGESGPGKSVMKKYGLHRDSYIEKIEAFLQSD